MGENQRDKRLREHITQDGFYSEWSGLRTISINPWPVGSEKWDWWNEGTHQAAEAKGGE